jgi:dipeptidyl aminopeptidase/acylaminoacyl peptidase
VIAVHGDLVAWVDTSDRVHLTDTVTCDDRPGVAPKGGVPLQATPSATGAFSPDGQRLALVASDQDDPGKDVYFLEVIDLATTRATLVGVGLGFPIVDLAWTPDGTRLFCLTGAPIGGVSPAISMWRLGDASVQPLRVFNLGVTPPLFVVP